jgi:hypothetical protein
MFNNFNLIFANDDVAYCFSESRILQNLPMIIFVFSVILFKLIFSERKTSTLENCEKIKKSKQILQDSQEDNEDFFFGGNK